MACIKLAPSFYYSDRIFFPVRSGATIIPPRTKDLDEVQFDVLVLDSVLHNGDNSTVYTGHFLYKSKPVHLEYDVVFKFGVTRRISEELSYYAAIPELQGTVIPRVACAGTAVNRTGTAFDARFGWFAIERFGTPVGLFIHLYREEKARILQGLQAIHDVGFIHADFDDYNVLEVEGPEGSEFRIIDFDEMAADDHCDCPSSGVDWMSNPGPDAVECKYMHLAAITTNFWDNGLVYFRRFAWTKDDLPSGRIMEQLSPIKHLDLLPGQERTMGQIFQRYFRNIKRLLDNKETVASIKLRIPQLAAVIKQEYADQYMSFNVSER